MKKVLDFFGEIIGWFILIILLIILIVFFKSLDFLIKIFKNDHSIRALVSLFGGTLFFFIILLFSSKIIISIIIGFIVSIFCFFVLSFLEGCTQPKNN
jgi:hypothetical protein